MKRRILTGLVHLALLVALVAALAWRMDAEGPEVELMSIRPILEQDEFSAALAGTEFWRTQAVLRTQVWYRGLSVCSMQTEMTANCQVVANVERWVNQ